MHNVQTEIILIVIGALETVPKRLPKYLTQLVIPDEMFKWVSMLLGTPSHA